MGPASLTGRCVTAVALIALVVGCNKSPTSPVLPTPTPTGSTPSISVELVGPDELSACTEETSRLLHALGEPDYVAALSPGEVHVVRILDVGGTRVVIDAARRTDATPAAIAGLESISDSIDIAP